MSLRDGVLEVLSKARELGFLGPGPVSDQWEHAMGFAAAWKAVAHSSAGIGVSDEAPMPSRILDLGSGGGVPGLALAWAWPDAQFTLLDASHKKTQFLAEEIDNLGVGGRMSVSLGRAEERGRDPSLRASFDLVVARGFASPPVTAECAAPFMRVGALLVVSEPPAQNTVDHMPPLSDLPPPARRWGGIESSGLGLATAGRIDVPFSYQVLIQRRLCDARYPRRVGIPAKRPLF